MMEYLTLENIALAVTSLITLASVLIKVLDMITDVHPNERLDTHITKARRWTAKIQAVMDKLALTPNKR